MTTATKAARYIIAFLLCAIGLSMIAVGLSGRIDTYLGMFVFHGGGLIIFYFGNRLGWLTYDPAIENRPEQKRQERIDRRTELLRRKRIEESQRTTTSRM